jgi:hypothetical protein
MDELTDDDFLDDFGSDFGNLKFERIAVGRYAVSAWLTINGNRHEPRIQFANTAYGFQKLGEQIDAILTEEFQAQHKRPSRLGSSVEGKTPSRKRRQEAEE